MFTIDDPQVWRSRVFCMISPDCLARQLTGVVLDRFTVIGLHPVGWRLAPITTAQIDRMSELQKLGADQVYRYRALDALFELGPALMLVLADRDDRPAEEIYRLAKELKGHSDPLRAAPGTIRRDLGSVNLVMNLLHVSDAPEHSAREAESLGGTAFYEGDVRELLRLAAATRVPERRMFREVLTGVRGRVLIRMWHTLTPGSRSLVADLLVADTLADAESTKVLAHELAHDGSHPELAAILAMPFDSSVPPPDMSDVQRCLAWHGLTLDPWEKAVLTTSGYFPPVR